MSDKAAVISATAAAISASAALATSAAAWLTIRGRGPKLRVQARRGDRTADGMFVTSPAGTHLAIRVTNERDADVGVNQIYFEPRFPWDQPGRYLPDHANVMPASSWWVDGSPSLPTKVDGHFTADFGVNADLVNYFFAKQKASRFRVVARAAGDKVFQSEWILVHPLPSTAKSAWSKGA